MDKEKQQCVAAIMGLVVGDALGVPVEFVSRRMLKNNPVVTMKGYGTHQPDYKLLMDKFQKWVFNKQLFSNEIDGADIVFNVSALTHAHARSKVGCLFYSKIVADIMNNPNMTKFAIVEKSLLACKEYLESAIWCLLNTDNYKDCVLKAVNLGDDTDTVGAVAGGLAGLYYGYNEIPKEWIDIIPKKDWIEGLAMNLV